MVHFFDADIAKKYGVNAAVLACFLWDCTEQKSAESPQLHEGKVWVRCSVQMMTGFSVPVLRRDPLRPETTGQGAGTHKRAIQREPL